MFARFSSRLYVRSARARCSRIINLNTSQHKLSVCQSELSSRLNYFAREVFPGKYDIRWNVTRDFKMETKWKFFEAWDSARSKFETKLCGSINSVESIFDDQLVCIDRQLFWNYVQAWSNISNILQLKFNDRTTICSTWRAWCFNPPIGTNSRATYFL